MKFRNYLPEEKERRSFCGNDLGVVGSSHSCVGDPGYVRDDAIRGHEQHGSPVELKNVTLHI